MIIMSETGAVKESLLFIVIAAIMTGGLAACLNKVYALLDRVMFSANRVDNNVIL